MLVYYNLKDFVTCEAAIFLVFVVLYNYTY